MPFTSEEVDAIFCACDQLVTRGTYGRDNRHRVKAFIYILRYTGLDVAAADCFAYGFVELGWYDREPGDGFHLVGGARRLLALHLVEVGVVVEVDERRRRDRADRDQGHGDHPQPEALPHPGTAASDSQR